MLGGLHHVIVRGGLENEVEAEPDDLVTEGLLLGLSGICVKETTRE